MKRAIFTLILLALWAPAHAQKKSKIPFERYTLANGLEVILHEDRRLPQVTVNIWYHVGAAEEREGRSGFAHLFEHMMFQGSRHVGDDQHFAILEAIGATGVNATTSFDRTNYFQTVPRNQLETVLWLESDRMGYLPDAITQKALDNQRDVVRNERRQRTDNRPYGKGDERVVQLLFPEPHPYHGAIIGSHEDLQAATLDDVKDFFRTYYAPSNATLVVAGDFDKKQTRELIEKYFGTLPAGDKLPARTAARQAPPDAEVREVLTDDVQLAKITFAWVTVGPFDAGAAELDVVAGALGGTKSSVLYKTLVYDKKIAQEVTCSHGGYALGGLFTCAVIAKPDASLDEIEKEVDAALARGVGAEDVKRTRTRILAQLTRSLESVSGRADRLNRYNHYLKDPGYFEKDVARYTAVTAGTAKAAATKWLDPKKRVVVRVVPKKEPK